MIVSAFIKSKIKKEDSDVERSHLEQSDESDTDESDFEGFV